MQVIRYWLPGNEGRGGRVFRGGAVFSVDQQFAMASFFQFSRRAGMPVRDRVPGKESG